MKLKKIASAFILAAGMLASVAQAGVARYSSQSAFEAAIHDDVVHGFTDIGEPYFAIYDVLTVDGVSFSSNGYGFLIGTGWFGDYNAPFYSGQSGTPNTVSLTFSARHAIGFSYGSYIDSLVPVEASLNTGDVFSFVTPNTAGTTGFIGFISDTELTSVTFTESDGLTFDILNFITGRPASTNNIPEPGSLVLLGVALAGLGFARKTHG